MNNYSKKLFFLLAAIFIFTVVPSRTSKAINKLSSEDLVFGKKYNVICDKPGDFRDYYFTLQQSGQVSFSVEMSEEIYKGIGYVLLYDEAGACIYTEGGGHEFTDSISLLAGNYILSMRNVGGFGTNNSDYVKFDFAINYSPSGETVSEFQNARNNSMMNATPYPGGDYVGQIAYNDDKDVYSLTISSDCFTTINYTPSFRNSSLELVNNEGDVTYNENEIPYGQQSFKYFTPAGTYYLTISSGITGVYKLSTVHTPLSGITLKTLKKTKSKGFKVKYTTNPDIDGYQICYSISKKFGSKNKYLYVQDRIVNSCVVKGLKKKKTYYVRVRAYKKYGYDKYSYSSWSNVKKIKIK